MNPEPEKTGRPPLPVRRILARTPGLLLTLFTILAVIAASYYALIAVSSTEIAVGPLRVAFKLEPAWHGKSVVDLPPAGTIEADTHSGPAEVTYSLEDISVDDVGELTDPGSAERAALENWRDPVGDAIRSLVVRILLVTALVGGVVAGLLRRRWQWALAGVAIGLCTALGVGGLAYATYDTSAFSEPRYTGSLTYAPDVLAFSQETLANLSAFEDRVPEIADDLYRTLSALQQLPLEPPEVDTIRILHVSDMHSSDAGARLVQSAVTLYDASLVIDTGDLTDLGTSLETGYPSTYLPLPVPYVWIGGNHDTPAVVQTMRSIQGVTVLDSQFTTIDDVLIGGFPDPASQSLSPQPSSDSRMAGEAARIAGVIDTHSPRAFIAAVHDPKEAARLAGKVAVVVEGHTHRESITVANGTVFLDAGTTGGGGFRGINRSGETPNSLQVLYLSKNPLKLVAVDSISIFGFSQQFSVSRRVFGPDEGIIPETEIREAEALASG